MKTTIYGYNFHLPDDIVAYTILREKLKATPGRAKLFDCIGTRHFIPNEPTEIELDTSFINSNQWNATPGGRVFDWYEDINPRNRNHKIGHYLDISKEMIDVRQNTYVCGYCGAKYPTDISYCTACLGSEYLEESNLNLLQLKPAALANPKRKLPPEVFEQVRQRWLEAQTRLNAVKLEKFLNKINQDFEKETRLSNIKYDGYKRMAALGLPAYNAIFYAGKNVFCFGWQKPISTDAADIFLKKLRVADFPYPVECITPPGTFNYLGR